MKMLVDIDEDVLRRAMELSKAETKKAVIVLALEELIRSRLREKLKQSAGSGMIGTKLSDLKRIRYRREKVHRNLRMVKR
jgi:Arc/MetJ family transcription regulator